MSKSFDQSALSNFFTLCVKGYHMLNTDPIKEAVWESINAVVFKYSGIQIISQACGSHSSGSDIETDAGKFSNKSAKYEGKCSKFAISSYRLTAVTNAENVGSLEEIFKEINERKNFEYYSVILREELERIPKNKFYMIGILFQATTRALTQKILTGFLQLEKEERILENKLVGTLQAALVELRDQ